jgi:hypothetical protein
MYIIPDEPIKDKQSRIEIEAEKKHEFKYFGETQNKEHLGLVMWELNYETLTLKRADILRQASMNMKGQPTYKNQLVINQNCTYLWALNEKNAVKKSKKFLIENFAI